MFDLAIVGAGIIGACAAYLARRSRADWHIALIDRSLVASGATMYSAGQNHPYGRTELQRRLSYGSAAVYRELKERIPGLPLYDIRLFGIASRDSLDKVLAGFTREGVRLAGAQEEEELRRSIPDLRLSDGQVLLTGCTSGFGFPRLIAQQIVDLFRESPLAECWEGVEIQDVSPRRGGHALTTSDGRTLSARRVLAATGPWALRGPGTAAALKAGVRIKKVVTLHSHRPPAPDAPILYLYDEDCYLLPVHQQRQWLFSFTSQEWDVAPDSSTLKISAEDRRLALAILGRYSPLMAEHCRGGRVFCDAYSPNFMPVVSQVADDYVFAGAGSGYGFRLAPAIAQEGLKHLSGLNN